MLLATKQGRNGRYLRRAVIADRSRRGGNWGDSGHSRPSSSAGATEPLRIAVRGQHIERWLSPRRAFPEGKAGYFGWRNAAKKRHAERLGQIMAACGYDEAVIARVGALARKEQLRNDAEAQTLEDVACLVFLRYYAENFAAKHAREKVFDILLKTQRKMSPRGRAVGLDFGFPAPILALYKQGLRVLEAAPAP